MNTETNEEFTDILNEIFTQKIISKEWNGTIIMLILEFRCKIL